MKYFREFLVLLSFMFFAVAVAGCAALLVGSAAGAGSVVYVKGQLKEDMNVSVPAVHDASISTLKGLSLPIFEDNHDKLSARIKSRFANGDDVWIEIESITAKSSKITIRVGILGDQNKSRQILDGIHTHLPGGGRQSWRQSQDCLIDNTAV
jgi:hypothetical protein